MPNLRQLEYLVALADARHFRRAAERTNTTQPTLSEQLKALELRLGCQLVERTPTGVVVTPKGRDVVALARRMLSDAAEIKRIAASDGRALSGTIRLGLPPTIGPYLMQRAGPRLRERCPAMHLYVREELPQALPRAVEEGTYDIAVVALPVRLSSLASVPLLAEPLYLAVGAGHPLAGKPSVGIADLAGEDILLLGPGHQLHDTVVMLGEEAGARLRFDFEGTSLDMLREMVAMGMGVTFVPGLYAESRLKSDPSVRLLSLHDRKLERTLGLAMRKGNRQRELYEALAREIAAAVGDCAIGAGACAT